MLYALDSLISCILDAWKTTIHPGIQKLTSQLRHGFSFHPEKLGFLRRPFFCWLRSLLYDAFLILSGSALIAVIWYFCFTI